MEVLAKFARGEISLARTFWLGYIGVGIAIAVVIGTFVTFVAPTGSGLLILVALAWALFASWAVVKAAGYSGKRSAWGWVATFYVILASSWAVFSLGRIFLL